MPIAQAEPEEVRRPARRSLWAAVRGLVLFYAVAAVGCGYLRLRAEGFSREGWGHALTLVYVEALSFLAVFGGAALIGGVLGPQARERRRRRKAQGLPRAFKPF